MSRTRSPLVFAALAAVLTTLALPESGWTRFRRVVVRPRVVRPVVRPTVVRPVVGPTFFLVAGHHFNAGSYLHGAAAVIDAQGQFLQSRQEASLLREQVRAAQVDNRRRVFDQYRYERANTPTLEEQREFQRQQRFRRSWNNPPLTEIWSGKSLNELLTAVQMARSEHDYRGDAVPLDPELVQRINVTAGNSGSIGLFRHGEDLPWPLPLQRDIFDQERQKIDKLAPQVVKQVASGTVDVQALDGLNQAIAQLRARVRDQGRDLSSTEHLQALRFANQLIDSGRALQGPGAANFFNNWTLSARSVGELVDQMTQRGLRFAPVTLGEEALYTALHRALVTYASGLPHESLRELRAQFYAVNSPRAGK